MTNPTCYVCDEKIKKKEPRISLDIFDSPWQDAPTHIVVHDDNDDDYGTCFRKLTDTSWSDFRYFECDKCGRYVIRQCPRNGWHSYVRRTEDGGEICLRCYEEDLYAYGHPREIFERGQVPGMFFNHGNLEAHGFEPYSKLSCAHITGTYSAKRFCQGALRLIDEGHIVIVEYDRMAIGGLEGYVSLWTKKEADHGIV